MGGKVIEKGWVITPGIAAVLLASFLAVLGYAYKASTSDSRETRDAIIRMETMLNERTTNFKDQQSKLETKLDSEIRLAQLQRDKQNDRIRDLEVTSKHRGDN